MLAGLRALFGASVGPLVQGVVGTTVADALTGIGAWLVGWVRTLLVWVGFVDVASAAAVGAGGGGGIRIGGDLWGPAL